MAHRIEDDRSACVESDVDRPVGGQVRIQPGFDTVGSELCVNRDDVNVESLADGRTQRRLAAEWVAAGKEQPLRHLLTRYRHTNPGPFTGQCALNWTLASGVGKYDLPD